MSDNVHGARDCKAEAKGATCSFEAGTEGASLRLPLRGPATVAAVAHGDGCSAVAAFTAALCAHSRASWLTHLSALPLQSPLANMSSSSLTAESLVEMFPAFSINTIRDIAEQVRSYSSFLWKP